MRVDISTHEGAVAISVTSKDYAPDILDDILRRALKVVQVLQPVQPTAKESKE